MRGLSMDIMGELSGGILTPLLQRVKEDRTLCLEIRDEGFNIYYRGGSLLRVEGKNGSLKATFNANYFGSGHTKYLSNVPNGNLSGSADVDAWLGLLPHMKQEMDFYMTAHPKEEREAQQLILRENNFGGMSNSTDYYICDIEYAHGNSRFDMAGVYWPSKASARKKDAGHQLALIEVKYGDRALAGNAGLQKHVDDVAEFVSDPPRLEDFKKEMAAVFRQKRDLGLINCPTSLEKFSDEPARLLLVFINHDPASTVLRRELTALKVPGNLDLFIASGCFMGYGLFNEAVLPLDAALTQMEMRF